MQACDESADCDAGDTCQDGSCLATASTCGPAGYCSQCTAENEATVCAAGEFCLEGSCSPRLDCSIGRHYVCARGLGECDGGTCVGTGAACNENSDCSDSCEAESCVTDAGAACASGGATCACSVSGAACPNGNADCTGPSRCRRTPSICQSNGDCTDDGGTNAACTTSFRPLRLNDQSCRYRDPGQVEWPYARASGDVAANAGDRDQRAVFTPQLDELAMTGAVFPRSRGNGQVCWTGRQVITSGRLQRHRRVVTTTKQCGLDPDNPVPIDHAMTCKDNNQCPTDCTDNSTNCLNRCGTNAECAQTSGTCDVHELRTAAWWMLDEPPRGGAEPEPDNLGGQPGESFAVGKSHGTTFQAQAFQEIVEENNSANVGKFACDHGASDPGNCPQELKDGLLPLSGMNPASSTSLEPTISSMRNAPTYQGANLQQPIYLYYAPHMPHPDNGVHVPATPEFLFGRLVEDAYPLNVDDGEHFLMRDTWTDAGIETLVNELKRTCVCGANGAESLWDNTVLQVVVDNAWGLPDDKQNDRAAENGHRQAMIVSTPETRRRAEAAIVQGEPERPGVYYDANGGFSANQDLLPTTLSATFGDRCEAGVCEIATATCVDNSACTASGDTCGCSPEDVCLAGVCARSSTACQFDWQCCGCDPNNTCDGGTCSRSRNACVTDTDCCFARCGTTKQACTTSADCCGGQPDCIDRYVNELNNYPMAQSLLTAAERGPASGFARNHYGHHGEEEPGENFRVYLVPDASAIGVCVSGSKQRTALINGAQHVKPCLVDDDCGGETNSCNRLTKSNPNLSVPFGRCFNKPELTCDGDDDCGAGSCPAGGGTCASSGPDYAGFPDFKDDACATGIDCVPRGACRPPLLKFVRKRTSAGVTVAELYDLNADPDEQKNLLAAAPNGDPYYLGETKTTINDPATQCPSLTSMHDVIACCLEEFYTRDTDKLWRPRDFHCPEFLREWEVVYQAP